MNEALLNSAAQIISRLRAELGATQSVVAKTAKIDQGKLSRIEKGEIASQSEVEKVVGALAELGSTRATEFLQFAKNDWQHVQPPSFWNPERSCLELAEEALRKIAEFLRDEDRPWPLRRQIKRYEDSLLKTSGYLSKLEHNIVFIGDIGVGKSTAISYVFDLLTPSSSGGSVSDRPVLETGAGGTTICEVHIKDGPEFGLTINPMPDIDVRAHVSDFANAKWAAVHSDAGKGESASVSREIDRAIRNMSKLTRKKKILDKKPIYHDPIKDLIKESVSEEDFRLRLLELMKLSERTRSEVWYDSSTRKSPMEWITETFKAINNGRVEDCPLPICINLLIPGFNVPANDLSLTVIDTKGVDDVAVREDLDSRLKDPRTLIVFCSRFNDAPGTSAKVLLQHMKETISENIDEGKVMIIVLPRSEEARSMKDDMGDQAETDEEGYEFKSIQLYSELANEGLSNILVNFINVGSDDPEPLRLELMSQVSNLRKGMASQLSDLCAATQDIIENHEAEALNSAIEEVAKKLGNFLSGNSGLSAREWHAYHEPIEAIKSIRYPSTLWASTRRGGVYSGLNVTHLMGVGAARDAKMRADIWFKSLEAFLAALEADEGLEIARSAIEQIRRSADQCKSEFVEMARSVGVETYAIPLSKARVWGECSSEWGKGAGFKSRVISHLERWFKNEEDLKKSLEDSVLNYFERLVLASLRRLTE